MTPTNASSASASTAVSSAPELLGGGLLGGRCAIRQPNLFPWLATQHRGAGRVSRRLAACDRVAGVGGQADGTA